MTPLGPPEARARLLAGEALEGVAVDGPLSLDGETLGRVRIAGCTLVSLSLRGAKAASVSLEDLTLGGHLALDGLEAGRLSLRGCRVRGAVSLAGARIAGEALVSGGRAGTGRSALFAEHLAVGRRLRIGGGFEADGPVDLTAARLDGLAVGEAALDTVRLDRAEIGDLDVGEAAAAGSLDAAGLSVRGRLRLAGVLRGPVTLAACTVGGVVALSGRGAGLDVTRLNCGRLDLAYEAFEGPLSVRQSRCAGLTLAGAYVMPKDAPLHLGVDCQGRAALGPARIAGALSLIGAHVQELALQGLAVEAHAEGRWAGVAIAARHLAVDAYLRFGPDVTLAGAAAFDHARLGDDLRFAQTRIDAPESIAIEGGAALSLRRAALAGDADLSGLSLGGNGVLDLSGAAVAGALKAGGLALEGDWRADLSGASVGSLEDAEGRAWGQARLALSGLTYGAADGAVKPRLKWIETHAGPAFDPQPWRALVAALGRAGDDEGIKRTELAARRRQRRHGTAPWPLRMGGLLLELTSGYGYAPGRAALTLVVYFLIGWAGVSLAAAQGAFEASPFLDGSVLALNHPGVCPWLEPPLYALDLMVPLTTLGNEAFCSVRTGARVWSWAAVAYRLFGWVILSIAVLTFSGIMKREV